MRAFCAVLLCRVVDFNIAFWARWTWIWFGHWSMVSIPHSPVEGICQSLFAYVCLRVGWGVRFECHVCWGWAQGFCLRWSMLSPYRCSACTGIGCFGGCFWVMHLATDGRINMIFKRVQQNGRLARWQRDETNWNYINDMQWMQVDFVSICNWSNSSIICIICSCWFKFWKLRLSLLSCGFFCPRLRKRVGTEKNLWQESPVTK